MLGRSFNSMLSGRRLGTLLRWQRAHRCPCASTDGEADQSCGVCFGKGRYYDAWSQEFRAGFLSQDSQTLMQMMKQFGGAVSVGDAVVVIPSNAPCYEGIGTFDRIQLVNSTDTIEWALAPGTPVRLPPGAEPVSATVRNANRTATLPTAFPVPGTDGRIQVAVPTTIQFRVARLYEVSRDLPRVRGFDSGQDTGSQQPKRLSLSRVDWSVR